MRHLTCKSLCRCMAMLGQLGLSLRRMLRRITGPCRVVTLRSRCTRLRPAKLEASRRRFTRQQRMHPHDRVRRRLPLRTIGQMQKQRERECRMFLQTIRTLATFRKTSVCHHSTCRPRSHRLAQQAPPTCAPHTILRHRSMGIPEDTRSHSPRLAHRTTTAPIHKVRPLPAVSRLMRAVQTHTSPWDITACALRQEHWSSCRATHGSAVGCATSVEAGVRRKASGSATKPVFVVEEAVASSERNCSSARDRCLF